MESCTLGTFWGFLWTEHAVLGVIGILVELVVIFIAVKESVQRRSESAALKRAADLLRRFAGAVQMAKAVQVVQQSPDLRKQFEDLGQRYEAWNRNNSE